MIHKPHTWVQLNKHALEHNLVTLKTMVGNGILAPVLKGNAYGHGLLEVGSICQQSVSVDWVCVASLSDALKLRNDQFTKPILVLVYLDDNPRLAIEQNIDVLISNIETLNDLHAAAQQCNRTANIHIKIDTGLSRFGFDQQELITIIKQIQKTDLINIRGLATHFACSEIENQAFTQQQISQFQKVIRALEKRGIVIPLKHASNSAATIRFVPKIGNFFRPGASIYGFWSSDHLQKIAKKLYPTISLKPVLTWKTRIFSIKTVPANRSVGYHGTYTTHKKTILATIPIGYQEGYPRQLSNKGQVLIKGKLAPIIGLIGMNTTTLDVTHIANVAIGDEATLIGDYPGIRAGQVSTLLNTNIRKITTCITPTINRIIIEEPA